MGRLVDVDNLVDAQEIADRLGLSHRQNVDNLKGFPAPLGMWGKTRIWDWSDVQAWARQTGRLPEP
jgi:hypothetical protein